MLEKLEKNLMKIDREFKNRGYDITEDLYELVEAREDVAEKIAGTKFSKIEFFNIDEEDSVGFTLEDLQVNFFIEHGEDNEGPWYEATAEIFFF
ncbi:MAG: hypothetical protein MJH09_07440 [Cetobacterium sp.]|uniref:Uncharacterized protein n=1 Tax=Cetobacterium ceti TaxID=180163 RepID=A0A1T4K5G7_9FUSO|nr:hypothetical protein [Cetobacterium ceti]MCJ8342666.1 hypothetical protein [Cetobacterium sp.]SJZ37583.1 hypothetical protein SAMN02745174_00313 [Cetobacterium ceti]